MLEFHESDCVINTSDETESSHTEHHTQKCTCVSIYRVTEVFTDNITCNSELFSKKPGNMTVLI